MKKLLPLLLLVASPSYADITQKFVTSAQISVDMPFVTTQKLGTTYSLSGNNITPSVTSGGSTTSGAIGGLNVSSLTAGVPAMIHVSGACQHSLDTTSSYYLGADTTAFTQLLFSDVFVDFPDLKLIIPHGGGAVPYHWGRFRGIAQDLGLGDLDERVLDNIYFDTCVYHQRGIDLLLDVIPTKNILFASEMIGAVRGIDPRTGHHYDDTKRYIDRNKALDTTAKQAIFEGNARRVFSRLRL